MSKEHTRILRAVLFWSRLFLVLALVLLSSGILNAEGFEVTLAWDANDEPEVTGYKIYLSWIEGVKQSFDVGNVTEYTVKDLVANRYYIFEATAYCELRMGIEEGDSSLPVIWHSEFGEVQIIPASELKVQVKKLIFDYDNDCDIDGSDLAESIGKKESRYIHLKFGKIGCENNEGEKSK